MIDFKQLGIKAEQKSFVGTKIPIRRILDKQVVVHAFKIKDSKFNEGAGKCLYLQISLNNEMNVVFTGSVVLMDMIAKVTKEHFPFTTTIVEANGRYEFT